MEARRQAMIDVIQNGENRLISFIVPAYDEEILLGATLDALHAAGEALNEPYELIVADDAMRTMIHDGVSEQEIERHARSTTPSIRDDGRARVLRGETTIEEVLRVTRED